MTPKDKRPAPRPLDPVELEIVRADMAFALAEEKTSGAWDNWRYWQDAAQNWRKGEREAIFGKPK
jgi:hypothetical protein